jgi:hypothetical protein
MGGDLSKNRKLMHVGIFVRGEKPAAPAAKNWSLADLDFTKLGSLNLIVTTFPGMLLPIDLMDELEEIWKSGTVRPDAYVLLRKEKDGSIGGIEGSALTEEADEAAINAVMAALASRGLGTPDLMRSKGRAAVEAVAAGDFGLTAAELRGIGEKLPADHSAVIALFENVWERRLRDVAAKHGGRVIAQRLITPHDLARAASRLAGGKSPRS